MRILGIWEEERSKILDSYPTIREQIEKMGYSLEVGVTECLAMEAAAIIGDPAMAKCFSVGYEMMYTLAHPVLMEILEKDAKKSIPGEKMPNLRTLKAIVEGLSETNFETDPESRRIDLLQKEVHIATIRATAHYLRNVRESYNPK